MNFLHVLNRGVDGRDIYLDDQDRFRFIHDLFEFNDENPANNFSYAFKKKRETGRFDLREKDKPRKCLVNIHVFCLMDNHYHLLVSSRTKDGVSKFMKKLNGGYSKYFNSRYDRNGSLFESNYSKVKVEEEPHFVHLPYYIHANPLDIFSPEWRDKKISDLEGSIDFLENYRWSSHLDYLGENNFPSVTQRDMFSAFFGDEEGYKDSLYGWLESMEIDSFRHLTLE
ncbi:MAG: transposase [Candidatus Magasanikbacteria bacterium]